MRGQTKHGLKTFMKVKNANLCTMPGGILGPCPGARPRNRSGGEHLVAGPFSIGSSCGQPEKEKCVRPLVGPPATEGTIEFWCYVDRVAVKGWGLGGPIPGY